MILTILFVISIFVAIWQGYVCLLELRFPGYDTGWISLLLFAASMTAIITRIIDIW